MRALITGASSGIGRDMAREYVVTFSKQKKNCKKFIPNRYEFFVYP